MPEPNAVPEQSEFAHAWHKMRHCALYQQLCLAGTFLFAMLAARTGTEGLEQVACWFMVVSLILGYFIPRKELGPSIIFRYWLSPIAAFVAGAIPGSMLP